ncbi:transposase [Streptomyces harbinensis]|uniref:transposase n=1 Tax=Streptomyces TaxID=1883 RepID=UPI00371FC77E
MTPARYPEGLLQAVSDGSVVRRVGIGCRGGLSDEQWPLIEPLLPDRSPRRGGRWTDHRLVIDAVAWRFRGNNAWRDLPECFGPWQTVYHRFSVWAKDGAWARARRRTGRWCGSRS